MKTFAITSFILVFLLGGLIILLDNSQIKMRISKKKNRRIIKQVALGLQSLLLLSGPVTYLEIITKNSKMTCSLALARFFVPFAVIWILAWFWPLFRFKKPIKVMSIILMVLATLEGLIILLV